MQDIRMGEASTVEKRPRGLVRAVKFLVLGTTAQAIAIITHFVYGARLYEDEGRLHVVAPAIIALILSTALAVAVWLRPSKPLFGVLALVTFLPFVAMFGIFHGAYTHVLKDILFFTGAPQQTLEFLFMSPDFIMPNDVWFEVGGSLTFPVGLFVAYRLHRLWREVSAPSSGAGTSSPPSSTPDSRRVVAPPPTSSGSPFRLVELALRMLFDSPFKSLGTLVGVVASVFLMTQQTSLLMGILGRVTSFVNGSGVDIWITSQATESTDATDAIPASRVGAAAGTPGVAWAAPVVQGIGRVTRPDGVREFVKVLGVEAPRYAGLPRTLAPGTTVPALRASRRIFLNWNDRPSFAAAEVGDRIEIDGQAGIVAGFFQGMDPHSPYYYIYANIDDARAFTKFPQDRITFVAVGAAPGENVAALQQRLQSRIPDALVKTRAEMSKMEERYFLVRTPVGLVFGMGSVVAALIGAAIVAVTMYSTAVDRARDYGTLKAIGARQKDILQLLLVQAALFSAAGYVLGMILFFIVRHYLPQLPMVILPKIFIGVAFAALGSCVLASLAAIRRVLVLDPGIVFR